MSSYLLDTNVLIALLDPDQQFHEAANRWFYGGAMRSWLSCPITENGVIRVVSLPKYPRSRPPVEVIESLRTLLAVGNHNHIPDDVSLLDPDIDPHRVKGSAKVTDTYLALLAHRHNAQLATFDRRISTAALRVPGKIYQIPV
ncbi:PIN domain-containing protein [Leucobacter coleopterorum]|uniref:Ribonuclease VapC n=1 Tax=Leucobacter coleopterorum TaxID=2714933 RepID=A0ABX6JZ01_9MICO|nr:TA system VapC family ribonuclease toxin [Leucobacter coleopterorum]QIM19555.1 PIN domain-containing protein [Leucobacter coleopterorum]